MNNLIPRLKKLAASGTLDGSAQELTGLTKPQCYNNGAYDENARLAPLLLALIECVGSYHARLGGGMSAALDDDTVCAEMKADINHMFAAIERLTKLADGGSL